MFDNKFLKSAKDPLVEAVKQAQADGEMRRQAEAQVNEEFGVYSRKAVVREDLAAYDAAVEEAYKCMKEGNRDNKEKKKEHEEKTGMEHIKKMGGFPGQSPKRTARELTKEEKADKDYDKDGKIESPKDEVWGSRLRAAKMAGKMEEGMMDPKDSDATPASKTITKGKYEDPSTPKVPYSQLPKPGNRAGAVIDSAKGAAGMNEERKRTASVSDAFMKGQKANQRTLRTDGKSVTYHGNTIAKHEGDEVHVTTAGHSHSPSTRGHINGILSRLGSDKLSVKKGQLHHGKNPVDHDAWIKVKKSTVSEEQMNEEDAKHGMKAAILKRIRAKKMEEEASFNSAQETGKTVNEMKSSMNDFLDAVMPSSVKQFGQEIARQTGLSKSSAMDGPVGNMARRGKEQAPAAAAGKSAPAIKPVQTPSVGLGSKPAAPEASKQSFGAAFAAARKAAGGAGGKFTYQGKEYQTNIKGEKYAPTKSLKSVGTTDTSTAPKPAATTPAPAPSMANAGGAPKEPATPMRLPDSLGGSEPKAAAPEVKGSVTSSPEAPEKVSAPEKKKPVDTSTTTMTESFVSVGENKYRIV
jgi:hypothetical protein